MASTAKYKLKTLSNDLNINFSEIQTILSEYTGSSIDAFGTGKAIDEDNLNYLFDYLTQKKSTGNMMEFFSDCALYKEEEEKQKIAEKEKAEQDAIAAQKEKELQLQKEKEAEEAKRKAEKEKADEEARKKREALEKKQQKMTQPTKQQQFQAPNFSKNNTKDNNRQNKPKQQPTKPFFNNMINEPAVVVYEETDDGHSGIVAKKNVKVVDTRASNNVNLSKYNARNDELADSARVKTKDFGKSKQKFKNTKQNSNKNSQAQREEEQAKLRRIEQYEKDKKKHLSNIVLPENISVSELASKLSMTVADVVKKLMILGIMASASQIIDYDTASLVAEELGATVSKEVVVTIEEKLIDDSDDIDENLETRSPVVVVMGHVDHGKTSLLDAIRHTNVVTGEAGGITQHIGAYSVSINNRTITFLDTPGHAAFTAMRARGAQVTDVVILVVAADDGIMPQTIEAINHAQAANVPIVVAVNKMDKPTANFDKVIQKLMEYNMVPEQYGGDTICVPVSAVKGTGIDNLLEMVLLVADMKDLKANPLREAKGTVIEAKLDKGRGPVATVLVQNGTLHAGDIMVAGMTVGKIRTMINDKGARIKDAGPSTPVEVVGLSEVPNAGDIFHVVSDERMAKELVEQRKHEHKEEQFKAKANVSLDDLFSHIQSGGIKTLNLLVKADVQGSVEAVKASLEKLSNDEVKISVIHSAVGGITESDVILAMASKAIIIGFNVRPESNAKTMAEKEGIDIRLYRIIYDCLEEIEAAMKGMLAPTFKEVVIGYAEVRQTFKVSGVGTIAGSYVKQGKISRNAEVRLSRDNIIIHQGKIDSLKRFKDDAKEVAEGYECGIGLLNYNDIKEGDIIEAFINEEIKR